MRKIQDVRFRGLEVGTGAVFSRTRLDRGVFDSWWKRMSARESMSSHGAGSLCLLSASDASRLRGVYSADDCDLDFSVSPSDRSRVQL